MINNIFITFCFIIFVYILYKLTYSLFNVKEEFSVGGLKCPKGSKPDEETGTYCKETIVYTGGFKRYDEKLVTANDLYRKSLKDKPEKKYDVETSRVMNIRDLYANLCPIIYNEKQIELRDMAHRVNQLPGYTDVEIFNESRKIPLPVEPIPVGADYF